MLAHIDADAFFASVLQRKHPELRGKPLLALGMGGTCVIATSYEAKGKGVKTGMPYRDAIRLCPEALSVPSDFRETGLASEQLENILRDHCPLLEQMSIDEWFLDLRALPGGLPKDLQKWGREIQQHVLRMTALSVSVGIAPSKLLAKMASEERKPAGITVVRPSDIRTFLRGRPAEAIPGIGRRRSVHTQARNWLTAWDIASADREEVNMLFGKNGRDMQRELRGERLSPVVREPPAPKSISRCRSFRATGESDLVWAHLLQHLSYLTLKLRRHHLACRGVSVWIRDRRYRYESAHASSTTPLVTEESLLPLLRTCFLELREHNVSFTQAGAGLWHLCPDGSTQFSLFQPPEETVEEEQLQESLDALRDRYGRDVIGRGAALPVNAGRKPTVGLSIVE